MADSTKKEAKLCLTKSSENINRQILEYYYNFGQNRDLEKYLRLNRKANKSSSEGSLGELSGIFLNELDASKLSKSRQTKSLDCFERTSSSEQILDKLLGEDECLNEVEKPTETAQENDNPEYQIDQLDLKSKDGEPSVRSGVNSFNYRNQVEVDVSLPGSSTRLSLSRISKTKITDCLESTIDESFMSSHTPPKQYTDATPQPNEEKVKKIPESHTKAARILEWDSLGDIGYNRSFPNSNFNRSMSTIERSVLKDFFGERGIQISFPSKGQTSNENVSTERWRTTLENAKKKYCSSPNLVKRNSIPTTTRVSNVKTEHLKSTNLAMKDLSKKFESQKENPHLKSVARPNVRQQIPKLDKPSASQVKSREQSCQTSFIAIKDQLIQCNFSATSNSINDDQSLGSPSSFIYLAQQIESTENGSNEKSTSNNSNSIGSRVHTKSDMRKLVEMRNDSSVVQKDIDLGISLLCSLVESKNYSDRQKKKLARRIMDKITKLNSTSTTDESAKSSARMSGFESLSSSQSSKNIITSRRASVVLTNDENKLANQNENKPTAKDKKLTHPAKPFSPKNQAVADEKCKYDSKKNFCNQVKEKTKQSTRRNEVDPCLFETMKELLEPLTNSELEYDKRAKRKLKEYKNLENQKITDIKAGLEKQIHLKWVENEITRLENIKHLLITEGSKTDSGRTTKSRQISEPPAIEREYDSVIQSANIDKHRKAKTNTYDDTHSGTKSKECNLKHPVRQNYSNSGTESQQTRSKLKTPIKDGSEHDSSDSIRTFVKNKKHEFIENYKIAHSSRRSYDHPMMSDHYSEPGYKNIATVNKDFIFKTKYPITSGSNGFMSSESMSLPINSNNSSSTTTQPYNAISIKGVGVQTSDSVRDTSPIFGVKSTTNTMRERSVDSRPKKTVRAFGPSGKNQQIQVRPPTISYTLHVDTNKNTIVKENENLSLQKHLLNNCPRFYARSSRRQEILKEMQRLRQERAEEIRKIIENTSINSVNKRLYNIPPPTTKLLRVFSTKEMKAMTRKKQKLLTEVVDKVEKQKKEKTRIRTKILADVFNKRLQRQVHKGKLSLEHSITVI